MNKAEWLRAHPEEAARYAPMQSHEHTCGECVRYVGHTGACSAIYGPEKTSAERGACEKYWDLTEYIRDVRAWHAREEREREERFASNKDKPAIRAKWTRDPDYMGGYTNPYPICPNCEEPLYDTERCEFCGQAILEDERLKKWAEPPEIEHMDCVKCGGTNTVEYVQSKYNGHKHGHCVQCGMKFIE